MNTIGIDIGGTKITGIVFNGKKVVESLTIVTPKTLFEFEKNLLKLVDFLSAKYHISGVGVGMAGEIDAKAGVAVHSPNIPYVKNFNLVRFFKLNKIARVKIDNDANCFARAELLLGQGKKLNNFLALTLGTGIGGGIVIDRQLYRGQHNAGAELGHALVDGEFFEKSFQRFRDKKDFIGAGKLIGRVIASLINIFAPQAVILGGGYGHNESARYLPAAKKEIAKYIFANKVKTKILITKLNNAGALGATLLLK